MSRKNNLCSKVLFFYFPLFFWFFLYLLLTEGCSESFDSEAPFKTADQNLKAADEFLSRNEGQKASGLSLEIY